jgi:broad specificity phosphatase PhoE
MNVMYRFARLRRTLSLMLGAMLLAALPAGTALAQHAGHAGQGQGGMGQGGQGPLAAVPLDDFKVLIDALRQGGLVMLIRHERTELPSREDDYSRPAEDCRAQRNLSVAGTAGAVESGVVLRALDIPVGRVISSPMCRTIETARGMFGVGYQTDPRLLHQDPQGTRNLDVASAEMRDLLRDLAPGMPGTNIAVIGHGGMIHQVSGVRLSEGEVAVVRLGADGSVTPLGQFLPSDLNPFARDAMKPR